MYLEGPIDFPIILSKRTNKPNLPKQSKFILKSWSRCIHGFQTAVILVSHPAKAVTTPHQGETFHKPKPKQ